MQKTKQNKKTVPKTKSKPENYLFAAALVHF